MPALSFTCKGFVNGDTSASLTTQPDLSTTATVTSPVGAYPITITGAADPNYTITLLSGTLTVTPVGSPSFVITAPTSGSYFSGTPITIAYSASNVASGSTISFCYDTDTAFNGNEHWIEVDKVAAADGTSTYSWNTNGLAAGTYYVAGYLYDGAKWYTSHLTSAITVTGSSAGTAFAVTGPSSGSYASGTPITIAYSASNVASGSTISFCYDTDTAFNGNEHWIEVNKVAAADGTSTYSWNTNGLAAGTYYVAGYLYDGAKWYTSHLTSAITVTGSSAGTAFAVTGPSSGSYASGTPITIAYSASNVASGSTISFCYDTDTAFNGNEHWIEVNKVAAADGTSTYSWNTNGLAAGTYYVAGYLYDGVKWYTSHLTSAITVTGSSAGTAFAVTGPSSGSYVSGTPITIAYSASNVASGSTISFCYDTDTAFNGNEHWIEVDNVAAADGTSTYSWNTNGLAAGTYYVAGYLYDGVKWYTSHLTSAITVTGSGASAVESFSVSDAVFATLAESTSNSVKGDWLYNI